MDDILTNLEQKRGIGNTLDVKFSILGKVMNKHSDSWYFISNFGLPNKLHTNGPNRQKFDFT